MRDVIPDVNGSQHRTPDVGFLCCLWIARKFLAFPGGWLVVIIFRKCLSKQ